jgi:hypothetical protein
VLRHPLFFCVLGPGVTGGARRQAVGVRRVGQTEAVAPPMNVSSGSADQSPVAR